MQNHRIKIDNFENNQTVPHSLIVLKGHIEQKNCEKNNPNNNKINLQTQTTNKTTQITNNHFKFILLLKNHETTKITITFCCDVIIFQLTHFPRKSDLTVVPLYLICEGHDGRFQAPPNEENCIESALKRIDLCAQLLQCVFSEKFSENLKLKRKTFSIEKACQIFRSNLNYLQARKLNQAKLWELIGREILNSAIGSLDKKYLVFLSCTRYCSEKYDESLRSYEEFVGITDGYVALGGGGLALFGTGCLYTWPTHVDEIVDRFEDENLVDRRHFMDDSCYRGTLGACFSTTLGSVLHELCHTFDLGHTKIGIMGRGFDNIHKIFTTNYKSTKKSTPSLLKTHQSSVEFSLENRKTCVKSSTHHEDDDTFWTKHCLLLLYYHKWFNSYPKPKSSYVLKIDRVNGVVSSTIGIRVIELRETEEELVTHYWIFEGRVLKFSFQIPGEVLVGKTGKLLVVVEDNFGNLLKQSLLD